jgi:hypothetical protein
MRVWQGVSLILSLYLGSIEVAAGELVLSQYVVNSTVHVRYAETTLFVELSSRTDSGGEFVFTVQMPESAFVSGFRMRLVPGLWSDAVVDSKAAAEKTYQEAVASGKSAAQVKESKPERGMAIFKVPIFVRPNSTLQAELTYQELLERRLNKFTHRISVKPGMPVEGDVSLNALVYDPQGIATVAGTYKSKNATIVQQSMNAFNLGLPKALMPDEMDGEFLIEYDTKRGFDAGVVLAQDSYFVHFLSPEVPLTEYRPFPKAVHFVVDISGSMRGSKEAQALEAMISILGQLEQYDVFDVLLFDEGQIEWKGKMMVASDSNIQAAQEWCREMLKASGSTGIYNALQLSVYRLADVSKDYIKMSIFLSDGRASSGPTDSGSIREVAQFKKHQACLHSLGFGFNLDFDLLQALSWENCGVARRIYEEEDAADQLENFFIEFSQPMMRDLLWEWPGAVEERSLASAQSNTDVYFGGGEICTVGAFKPADDKDVNHERSLALVNDLKVSASVRGQSEPTTVLLPPSAVSMVLGNVSRRLGTSSTNTVDLKIPSGFAERLWAHLRIKSLLRQAATSVDVQQQKSLQNESLQLALHYSLVTPLTSLVVVEPEEMSASFTSPDASSESATGVAADEGESASSAVALLRMKTIFVGLCCGIIAGM